MKLLCTTTSYPPAVGGAQFHTHQIVKQLATRDTVRVISHWTEHRTDWLLGTTLRAPRQPTTYTVEGVQVQTITLSQRERWLLAPYVLSYYALKPLAIDRISEVLVPKLAAHAQGIELVHNARIGREPLSYASYKLARRLDVPFVFVPYHHPRWVGWNYREYLALYRQADALIALTHAEKQKLVELGVREERIFITGMGPVVAPHANPQQACERYGLRGPVVLFVGQQYKYKGVQPLLAAAPHVWQRFPDAQFVFVGPRTPFSKRLFASVHDPRVVELGNVSLQEKTDLLAACTLLCVPSSQESFGGVYTEAWAMGKPVIGGDIPAIRDVITEGEDGYLVQQEAVEIAARIGELLAHPARAARMGQRGRQKVLKHYTWDKLAQKTRAVYETLLR